MDNNFDTNNQQEQQPQGQFQQNNNYQQYQQPIPSYQPELEEPVSLGDWVGTLLLLNFVPCIGLIVCIIWAFSSTTKKSKANFCKAYLIIMLISLVLAIIALVAFGSIILAAIVGTGSYGYYY